MVSGWKVPNCVKEYKIAFLGKEDKLWNFPENLFLYYSIIEPSKTLNEVFWAIKFWYKPGKCQIFSPSPKLRFCEKDANLETFQKVCPHIAISYNFILKPAESLKQIIWLTEYWEKIKKCPIC